MHVYHVAPTTEFFNALPSGAMQAFYDGQIAMVVRHGSLVPRRQLEEQPDFEYAILPMPTGPGGHHGAVCWAGFGLSPTSENKDAAWLFLKSLGTEIGQRHYSEFALSVHAAVHGKTNRITRSGRRSSRKPNISTHWTT